MAHVLNDSADVEDLFTVRLSKVLSASRDRVYAAWTTPELMVQWWGPKGVEAISAVADARPGGHFAVEMRAGDGEIHKLAGVFTLVEPPARLAFEIRHRTFEGAAERPEGYIPTQVQVELREHADGTELLLTHSGFLDAAIASRFDGGWSDGLGKLATTLAAKET